MKKTCVLLSLLLAAPALAQPADKLIKQPTQQAIKRPAKKIAPAYDPTAIKPLSEVFKHLDVAAKRPANIKARALARADDALNDGKTARARALAGISLGDAVFGDYAHWIIGLSFEMDAEKDAANQKKNARAAQSAFSHFRAIEEGTSYSPLIRLAPRLLGQSELLVGYGLVPGKISLQKSENALMRLSSTGTGSLSDVTPDETLEFAKACKKSPDDLCGPWLLRLTEHMDRRSDEFDAISDLFPIVSDRPEKPEIPPRPTQTYHAPDLDLAAFDDAMTSYSSEKWDDAQDKLQKFVDEFPKSGLRFRARYWLARALIQRNHKDEAQKEYGSLEQETPLSFYGMLAAIDTDKPIDQQILKTEPMAVDTDPLLSAAETFHLRRAETLIAAKAYRLAEMDLREIRPRTALSSPFLMYLCALNARAKSYSMLFTLLTELIQRDYPAIASDAGLKMIFPIENMDEIQKYADQEKLDPVLVLSLIKQESAFDPRALSGSGASGLMQLMFFTATQVSPGISHDDLMKADPNVKTGTRYLANLMAHYRGNIVYSLAAYNAGPTATDRWVRDGETRKLDMLQFIESIPYHETRDYVSSIIRNYYWYSKILGVTDPDTQRADPKPLSYFWNRSP